MNRQVGIKQGVWLGELHSYIDFGLILSKAEIAPAEPKLVHESLDGGDGTKDLSEALGELRFNNRTGTFTFSVLPKDDFEKKKTDVANALNGLSCKVTLDKDINYYYKARLVVDSYQSSKLNRKIVVKFQAEPYKYKQARTETIFSLSENQVEEILLNDRKTAIPEVTATGTATIVFRGNTFTISSPGPYKFLGLQLKRGANPITVSGTGNLTFSYQEGAL